MAASVATYFQCSFCKLLFKDFAAVSTHACSKLQTKQQSQGPSEEISSQIPVDCSSVSINGCKERHETRITTSQPPNISNTFATSSGNYQSKGDLLVNSDTLSEDQSVQQIRSGSLLPNSTAAAPSQVQSQSSRENASQERIIPPSEQSGNTLWGRPDTLLLIDLYKTWQLKIKKKKHLWGKIAELMKLHKYTYSSEQCEGRWKTLLRSLKKVTDHNAKSGHELKKHPYEEQLDFLIEQPNIKPSYIVGSTVDGNLQSSVEENTNEDSDSDIDSSISERSASPAPPAPTPAKKKRSNVSEVLDVLKEHISVQNARQQENSQRQRQMHEERMAVMKGFLEVFKDMKKQ